MLLAPPLILPNARAAVRLFVIPTLRSTFSSHPTSLLLLSLSLLLLLLLLLLRPGRDEGRKGGREEGVAGVTAAALAHRQVRLVTRVLLLKQPLPSRTTHRAPRLATRRRRRSVSEGSITARC